MYCYVIYHPASCQVAEFYLSVTRKYCFPTSFDNVNIRSILDESKLSLWSFGINVIIYVRIRKKIGPFFAGSKVGHEYALSWLILYIYIYMREMSSGWTPCPGWVFPCPDWPLGYEEHEGITINQWGFLSRREMGWNGATPKLIHVNGNYVPWNKASMGVATMENPILSTRGSLFGNAECPNQSSRTIRGWHYLGVLKLLNLRPMTIFVGWSAEQQLLL